MMGGRGGFGLLSKPEVTSFMDGPLCKVVILALASVGALVTFRRNRRFFVLLKRNVDKVGEACEWKETRTWSICYIFRILKLCSFDS